MSADKGPVYDPTLVLLAPVIALALTEGMDERRMNLLGSFLSAISSSIFLLLTTKGGEEVEL